MFTGIITDIGRILARRSDGGDLELTIAAHYNASTITIGESIACNGVCLTVTSAAQRGDEHVFTVQLSKETVACTAPIWQENAAINLERAMKLGDSISGHLVSGHVDTTAALIDITPSGDSHMLRFVTPPAYAAFLPPKGSVTLNGVSLTINQSTPDFFTVNIIPHTWQHTNFHHAEAGMLVNLEVDLIARYVNQSLSYLQPTS